MGRAKERRKKKKKTKESGWDLCLWEGAEKEEKFPHTRKTLHWWGWGELWSLRGDCSNRGVEGKAERIPHRGSMLTTTPQPEILPACWGRWGLGAEARASEVRPQGED